MTRLSPLNMHLDFPGRPSFLILPDDVDKRVAPRAKVTLDGGSVKTRIPERERIEPQASWKRAWKGVEGKRRGVCVAPLCFKGGYYVMQQEGVQEGSPTGSCRPSQTFYGMQ